MLFFLILITLNPSFAEDVCYGDPEFQLDTESMMKDMLMSLYVDFSDSDTRGRELSFFSDEVSISGKVITFEGPQFNHQPINAFATKCVEEKENIFGRKVCRKREQYEVVKSLCSQLGLGEAVFEEKATEYISTSSTTNPFSYLLTEEGEWYRNRLSTALAPRTYYPRIGRMSCLIP